MHDRAYEDAPAPGAFSFLTVGEMAVRAKYASPLLNEREQTHGRFEEKAILIQNIKTMLRFEDGWDRLSDTQREALDMIVVKIGRIMTGDPTAIEHWDDIAGYAGLVKASLIRLYADGGSVI